MGKKENKASIAGKARNIRLLLLDVDGVLTDGKIYVMDNGQEFKAFDIHDGQGISLLHRAGIRVGIISGRSSPAVRVRAKELAISEVHEGVSDKLKVYEEILARHGLGDSSVAYVGDDLIDRPILERVGLSVAVANAHAAVQGVVHWVTSKSGGAGAIREVADFILVCQGRSHPTSHR